MHGDIPVCESHYEEEIIDLENISLTIDDIWKEAKKWLNALTRSAEDVVNGAFSSVEVIICANIANGKRMNLN